MGREGEETESVCGGGEDLALNTTVGPNLQGNMCVRICLCQLQFLIPGVSPPPLPSQNSQALM